MCAKVARCTSARVATSGVVASGAVLARVRRALVDVRLAVNTIPSARTVTHVAVDAINARRAVATRVARALVDVRLAVRAGVAGVTRA